MKRTYLNTLLHREIVDLCRELVGDDQHCVVYDSEVQRRIHIWRVSTARTPNDWFLITRRHPHWRLGQLYAIADTTSPDQHMAFDFPFRLTWHRYINRPSLLDGVTTVTLVFDAHLYASSQLTKALSDINSVRKLHERLTKWKRIHNRQHETPSDRLQRIEKLLTRPHNHPPKESQIA